MIPLRDDTERERAPVLALLAGVTAGLASLAALVGGAGVWTALLLLMDAGVLWILGAGVEGAVGRWSMLAALGFGGVGGAAMALVAGAGAAATVGAAAATVAALEVALTHLLRLRGATVMTIVLVPWFGGFAEIPAWVWVLLWGAAAAATIAFGAFAG